MQGELSAERQHSREQAERIAVLADQAQRLQLAQMSSQMIDGTKDSEGQDPHGEEDPAAARDPGGSHYSDEPECSINQNKSNTHLFKELNDMKIGGRKYER